MKVILRWKCNACSRCATTKANPYTHNILTKTNRIRQCRGRYMPIDPVEVNIGGDLVGSASEGF